MAPVGPSPAPAGSKVDISRGERIGRLSSEWFARPADERYLPLNDLMRPCAHGLSSHGRTVQSRAIRVQASRDDAERLALIVPGREEPIASTHRSFSQICSLVGAPAGYMRQLPAPLAGINMHWRTYQMSDRSTMGSEFSVDNSDAYLKALAELEAAEQAAATAVDLRLQLRHHRAYRGGRR